jgi:YD repeat-containing protein
LALGHALADERIHGRFRERGGDSSSITYSSTGNMTGVGSTTSMAYNKANRMASITVSGAATTFTYGADGYRLTQTNGANPTVVCRFRRKRPPITG